MKNIYWLLALLVLVRCSSYKQSFLFKTSESSVIKQGAASVQQAYVLSSFDEISIKVFTKNGERIIDPDNLLMRSGATATPPSDLQSKDEKFKIDMQGVAKLPMLGETKIAGLTLREVELLLQKEFAKFYENVFVTVVCESHRVVVLGPTGGQVIPLVYDNTSLAEVLAISKVLAIDSKAHNIRLLRADDVYVINFSTVESYHQSNMSVAPGDIIYVEPVRRPLAEGLKDYGSLLSITTSLLAILLVATR